VEKTNEKYAPNFGKTMVNSQKVEVLYLLPRWWKKMGAAEKFIRKGCGGHETLVASVLLGLGQYVKRGLPIRVKQSYITFSGSQEVSTMVISSTKQIAKWGKVTKGLISALLKR